MPDITGKVDVSNNVSVKGVMGTTKKLCGVLSQIGSGGGTTDHSKLSNRNKPDQHSIGSITGLEAALNGKQDKLIAGAGITIAADGKTISAQGGGSLPNEVTSAIATHGMGWLQKGDIEDMVFDGDISGRVIVPIEDNTSLVHISDDYIDASLGNTIILTAVDTSTEDDISGVALTESIFDEESGNSVSVITIPESELGMYSISRAGTIFGIEFPREGTYAIYYNDGVNSIYISRVSIGDVSKIDTMYLDTVTEISEDWYDASDSKVPTEKAVRNYVEEHSGGGEDLATVAKTGEYSDLLNKPDLEDYVKTTDLEDKQDKLIAGAGVTIGSDGKTISMSGEGGVLQVSYYFDHYDSSTGTLVYGCNTELSQIKSAVSSGAIHAKYRRYINSDSMRPEYIDLICVYNPSSAYSNSVHFYGFDISERKLVSVTHSASASPIHRTESISVSFTALPSDEDFASKLDINQGVEHAGELLVVGDDGNISASGIQQNQIYRFDINVIAGNPPQVLSATATFAEIVSAIEAGKVVEARYNVYWSDTGPLALTSYCRVHSISSTDIIFSSNAKAGINNTSPGWFSVMVTSSDVWSMASIGVTDQITDQSTDEQVPTAAAVFQLVESLTAEVERLRAVVEGA